MPIRGSAGLALPGRRARRRMRAPPALPQMCQALVARLRIARVQAQEVQALIEPTLRAQGRLAEPGFNTRSAPGRVDQSHGHGYGLLQLAREVVAGRGE